MCINKFLLFTIPRVWDTTEHTEKKISFSFRYGIGTYSLKNYQCEWKMSVIPATFHTSDWKTIYWIFNTKLWACWTRVWEKHGKIQSLFCVSFAGIIEKVAKNKCKKCGRMGKHQFAINWNRSVLIRSYFCFALPWHANFNHKITMANYLNKVKFNNKIGRRARPDNWNDT